MMAVCSDTSMVYLRVVSMVVPTEVGKVVESVDSMEFP